MKGEVHAALTLALCIKQQISGRDNNYDAAIFALCIRFDHKFTDNEWSVLIKFDTLRL
jgi:hypothetical protein